MGEGGNKKSAGRRGRSSEHRAQGTGQKNGTRKLRDGRRVEQNGSPPAESLPRSAGGWGWVLGLNN